MSLLVGLLTKVGFYAAEHGMDVIAERAIDAVANRVVTKAVGSAEHRGVRIAASKVLQAMRTENRSWIAGLTAGEQADALRVIGSQAFQAALVAIVEEPTSPTNAHQLGSALRAESRTLVRTGALAAALVERVRVAVIAELRNSPATREIYQTEVLEQVARDARHARITLDAMTIGSVMAEEEGNRIIGHPQGLTDLIAGSTASDMSAKDVVGHAIDTARARIRSGDIQSATTLLDEASAAVRAVREKAAEHATHVALNELEQRIAWSMAQISIIRGDERQGREYATRARAWGEVPIEARGVAAWVLLNQGHHREAQDLLATVSDSTRAISSLRAVASLESGDFVTAAASMPAITRKESKVGSNDGDVDSDVASALVRYYVSLEQWDRASHWFWILSAADEGSAKSKAAAMDAGAFLIQAFAAEIPMRGSTASLHDQARIIDRTSELSTEFAERRAELSGQSQALLTYRRVSFAVAIDEIADARRQWALSWERDRRASADLLAAFPWLDNDPEKFRSAAESVETEDRRLLLLGIAADIEGKPIEAAEFQRRLNRSRQERERPDGSVRPAEDTSVPDSISILQELQTEYNTNGRAALLQAVERSYLRFAHSLLYLRAASDFVAQVRVELATAESESQQPVGGNGGEHTEGNSLSRKQTQSSPMNRANELGLALASAMVDRLDAPAHHVRLGEAHFHLRQYDEVRVQIEVLERRSYRSRSFLNMRANLAFVLRHLDEAANVSLVLHREFDMSARSALRAGKAAFTAGRMQVARELFVEAMDTKIDDDYASAVLGIVEIDDLSDPTARSSFQFLRSQYEKRPHPGLLSSLVLSGTRAAKSAEEFAPVENFVTSAGGLDKVPGLRSMSEKEVVALFESSAEAARAAQSLYPLGAIPFMRYANAIGNDPAFVWLENSDRGVRRPTEIHEIKQLDVLRNGLIVDETAWFTLMRLGLIEKVLQSVVPLYITTQTFDSFTVGGEQNPQQFAELKRINDRLVDGISGYPDLPLPAEATPHSVSERPEGMPPSWATNQLKAATQIDGLYVIDIDQVRSALIASADKATAILTTRDILRILQSIGAKLPINELANAAQNRPGVFPSTLDAGRTVDSTMAGKSLVLSYSTLEAWSAVNLLPLLAAWPGGIRIPEDVRTAARAQAREGSLRVEGIALRDRLAHLIRDAVSFDRVRVYDTEDPSSKRTPAPLSEEESEEVEDRLALPALFDDRLAHMTEPCERLYRVAAAKAAILWTDDGATALFHSHLGPYIDDPPAIRLHAAALAARTPGVSIIGTGRVLEELTKMGVFTATEHLRQIDSLVAAGHWLPVTELSLTHALLSSTSENQDPAAKRLLKSIEAIPRAIGEPGMIRTASGLFAALAGATISAGVTVTQDLDKPSNRVQVSSDSSVDVSEVNKEMLSERDDQTNHSGQSQADATLGKIAAHAISIVRAWTLGFGGGRVLATAWWRSVALPAVFRGAEACPILEALVNETAKTPEDWSARCLSATGVQLAELGDLAPFFRSQSAEMFTCFSDACMHWDEASMYQRGWPRAPRTALAAWCGFVGVTKAQATYEYESESGTLELFEFGVTSEELAVAARQAIDEYLGANGNEYPVPPGLADRVVLERKLPNGRTLKFEQRVDRISVLPESSPIQQRTLLLALGSDARAKGFRDLGDLYAGFANSIFSTMDNPGEESPGDLSWFPQLGKALSHTAAYLVDYDFDRAVDAIAQMQWASLVSLSGDPFSWRRGETLHSRVSRLTAEAGEAVNEEERNQLLESARVSIAEGASSSLLVVQGMAAVSLDDATHQPFAWLARAVSSSDIDARLVALGVALRLADSIPALIDQPLGGSVEEIERQAAAKFPPKVAFTDAVSCVLEASLRALSGREMKKDVTEPAETGATILETSPMQEMARRSARWTVGLVEFGLAAQHVLNAAIFTDAHLREAGVGFAETQHESASVGAANDTDDLTATVAYISRVVTRRIVKRSVASLLSLAQEIGGNAHALLRRVSQQALSLREQRPYNNVRVLVDEAWRPDLELLSGANPYFQQLLLLVDWAVKHRSANLPASMGDEAASNATPSNLPKWWTPGIEAALNEIAAAATEDATAQAVEAARAAKFDRFNTVFAETPSAIASRVLEGARSASPRE